MLAHDSSHRRWGAPPWTIDFTPPARPLPPQTDFAIVGAGFTGLAAAAWLRLLSPDKSVAVLEAERIGSGASGCTGGMALSETAAGDLPGLGDVLARLQQILSKLDIKCDLFLPGAWEIARRGGIKHSPIAWQDSGTLRVVREVPGGALDPGKLVSGLARAGHQRGAEIFEGCRVERVRWNERGGELCVIRASAAPMKIAAANILFATNGLSLPLSGLGDQSHPKLTLAAVTAPIAEERLRAIGLSEGKPFYTVDFPYLWGRTRVDRSIVWGAGLVDPPRSGDLEEIDIGGEEPSRMFVRLEKRLRGLHPALADLRFTHQWGGPILFRDDWKPVFSWHPQSRHGIVLGAYAGHGVALSSYLGSWAAEVLLGRRQLPAW